MKKKNGKSSELTCTHRSGWKIILCHCYKHKLYMTVIITWPSENAWNINVCMTGKIGAMKGFLREKNIIFCMLKMQFKSIKKISQKLFLFPSHRHQRQEAYLHCIQRAREKKKQAKCIGRNFYLILKRHHCLLSRVYAIGSGE